MGLVGRLIVTSLVSAGVLLVAAYAWPLFTADVRPSPLDAVYEKTKDTSLGKDVSNVLGVSDQPQEPIDFSGILRASVSDAGTALIDSVHEIVARQAVNQLVPRYNALDERDKEILREVICVPPQSEASASASAPSSE